MVPWLPWLPLGEPDPLGLTDMAFIFSSIGDGMATLEQAVWETAGLRNPGTRDASPSGPLMYPDCTMLDNA